MSKYNTKTYARAFIELILGKKTEKEQKKMGENFLKLLEKEGEIKKAKEIILIAEKLYFQKTGKRKVILETARKIDSKNILKEILKTGDFSKEKVNPALVAGIKIIVNNEKQLDFSLNKKLQEMFER